MKILKNIIATALIFATLVLCLGGCGKKVTLDDYVEDTSTAKKDYYYVAMAIKDYGVIVVKLDATIQLIEDVDEKARNVPS